MMNIKTICSNCGHSIQAKELSFNFQNGIQCPYCGNRLKVKWQYYIVTLLLVALIGKEIDVLASTLAGEMFLTTCIILLLWLFRKNLAVMALKLHLLTWNN